ncbi:type II methionyl aminopeptidase [Candidatus Pacearchaeota archaeon]|nr:type II methionyl aminopeptidase [Candidatus Pacearchaeota archaeon]
MKKQSIIKAGEIAIEVKKYAKSFIKKDMLLLEIADKIESKIIELGGKPAFPTNTSINEVAAHYAPSHDDETKAHGLLKIDLGVHIDGYIADTAFSLDLENNEENKKLIIASQEALNNAIKLIKNNFEGGGGADGSLTTNQIGKIVQETIESKGFSPIINLSGHEMKENELHAGLTIPNIDDKKEISIKKGLYAIEPFATNGSGRVYDGKPSGIYMVTDSKNIRSSIAREVLEFILEEYYTLPFCSRWLVKKFGAKALFGLRQLEENGNLHHFPQLIETGKGKVAQAENTVLVEDDKVTITTEEN